MITLTSRTTGRAIYDYLRSKGIKQTWLAGEVELPMYELNRRLLDRPRYPLSPELVVRIATALDVPRAIESEWLALLD